MPAATADLAGLLDRAAAQHAAGDTEGTLATMREALRAAWLDTPLHVAKVVLVREESHGYGMYDPRPSNRYASGEPIRIYAEPVGYRYRRDHDLWRFGVVVDWLVLDKSGNVLAGKEAVLRKDFASHNPDTEFSLDLAYTLSNAAPGAYLLRTTVRDLYGDGRTSFENEVEIVPSASG